MLGSYRGEILGKQMANAPTYCSLIVCAKTSKHTQYVRQDIPKYDLNSMAGLCQEHMPLRVKRVAAWSTSPEIQDLLAQCLGGAIVLLCLRYKVCCIIHPPQKYTICQHNNQKGKCLLQDTAHADRGCCNVVEMYSCCKLMHGKICGSRVWVGRNVLGLRKPRMA
jgi:hypothetical protein